MIIECAYCKKSFKTKAYVALRPRPCCSVPCANAVKTTDPIIRFWSKVDKRGADECWNWIGHKDKDGYGTFSTTSKNCTKAHRYSYYLEHGDIDPGKCVLHKCDNPPCCNPKHLFAGTSAENDLDRDKKGRQALGERTNRTHLKRKDVLRIRALSNNGMTQEAISRLLGMSQTGVSSIVNRRTWGHV